MGRSMGGNELFGSSRGQSLAPITEGMDRGTRRFARLLALLTVTFTAFSLLALPSGAAADEGIFEAPVSAPSVASGEVLLSVDPGVDPGAVARRLSAEVVRGVPGRPDLLVVEAPAGAEAGTAARLNAANGVAWAAPNAVARIAAAPNDPLFRYQWNLADRAASAGSANWSPVNGTGVNGNGVTVGILDTGVTAHIELDQVLPGKDFVDGDNDASDPHGHGTHIGGTIAETTGNARGAAGVAPSASILPVRVLDAEGAGTYDDILAGLEYAADSGARILNLSFAGDVDAGLCDAVARITARGVLVVAAAGNESAPVSYPAACPSAIGVSAVNIRGTLASYSNRGAQIDLAAPGGDTGDTNGDGYSDGILQYSIMNGAAGYYFNIGTSMASPHVAGAAALLAQVRPAASPAELRALLTSSATDIGPAGTDSSFGAGLLNIAAAVTAAQTVNSTPTPPTTAPPTTSTTTTAPPTTTTTAPPPTTTTTSPSPTTTTPSPTTTTPSPTTTAPTQPTSTTQPPADSSSGNGEPAPAAANVGRVSGENRYATAAAASASSFPNGSTEVYLATGTGYADALATGGLSGARPGPLVLTRPCELPTETANELRRLRPARVTIVGGEGAVCGMVAADVARVTGASVERLAGANRYATSVALSRAGWGDSATTVYLASGDGFADGLGGGALAARGAGPLLLTSRCTLPADVRGEIQRLSPSRVVVLGGEGAVCSGVVDEVTRSVPASVTRVSGADRYSTAVAVAQDGWPGTATSVYVVGGEGFADGLAAGTAAARAGAPLLLVPSCGGVPASVADALRRLHPGNVTVVGGNAAVCQTTFDEIRRIVTG